MTTDNEAAKIAGTLSAEELAALESFSHGNEIEYRLQNILEQKGLLRAADIADDELTPLGRKTLAAHASVKAPGRVTVITAREFVEQGFAEKVKRYECRVEYQDKSAEIIKVYREEDGGWVAIGVPNPLMVAEGTIDPSAAEGYLDETGDYKFVVTWLTPPHPEGQPPAESGVDEVSMDDDISHNIDGYEWGIAQYYSDCLIKHIKPSQHILDADKAHGEIVSDLQAELTALRDQLQAAEDTIKHQGEVYAQEIVDHQMTSKRLATAEDTVRGLRKLAGRAADVLQSVALPFSYVEEFKDELRQAAKVGDE